MKAEAVKTAGDVLVRTAEKTNSELAALRDAHRAELAAEKAQYEKELRAARAAQVSHMLGESKALSSFWISPKQQVS